MHWWNSTAFYDRCRFCFAFVFVQKIAMLSRIDLDNIHHANVSSNLLTSTIPGTFIDGSVDLMAGHYNQLFSGICL